MALLAALLFSCAPAAETPVVFPTYDPFVPSGGNTTNGPENQPPVTSTETQTAIPTSTPTRPPTPTRVPLNISPLIGVQDQITSGSPTPDTARILPTPRQEQAQHTVHPGDTLGSIALQ